MRRSAEFLILFIVAALPSCSNPAGPPAKSWVVGTLAGGTQGFRNAADTAARFNDPSGVAVDAKGNVYVADNNNHRIRQIVA